MHDATPSLWHDLAKAQVVLEEQGPLSIYAICDAVGIYDHKSTRARRLYLAGKERWERMPGKASVWAARRQGPPADSDKS